MPTNIEKANISEIVIPRNDYFTYEHFTEQVDPKKAHLAHRVHARSYVGEGFINENAVLSDGTLPTDMDKARGDNVEYYIGYNGTKAEANAISTLRKIKTVDGDINSLPGFVAGSQYLAPSYADYLRNLPPEKLFEISSFGHDPSVSSVAGFELLRTALQDAVPNKEVWYFNMVTSRCEALINAFGPRAINVVGESFKMDDDRINDEITLTPTIVDTENFFENVRASIESEKDPIKRKRYTKYLTLFTDGLSERQMGSEVFLQTRGVDSPNALQKIIEAAPAYSQVSVWQEPEKFSPREELDRARLNRLIGSGTIRAIKDAVPLEDLFNHYYPQRSGDEEFKQHFMADMEQSRAAFGNWFHLPWLNAIVRYPEEGVHRKIRTMRNRPLITEEEQGVLFGAHIFEAGLSVGSHIVRGLAHAGIGGHFTLADFDTLSLSNVNRVDAGMPEVGEAKIDLIAKELSELDPYIKLDLMREGVSEDTLALIESNNDAPDLVIDEVDDLAAKALLRLFAQRKSKPLMMVTDVGNKILVDVERYDLNKYNPLFNGRLSQSMVDDLLAGNLTEKQKKRAVVKLVGLENATPRLLKSLIDPNTIGLPQLGSTVKAADGYAVNVTKSILLGRDVKPGRRTHNINKGLGFESANPIGETVDLVKMIARQKH